MKTAELNIDIKIHKRNTLYIITNPIPWDYVQQKTVASS